jgi:uncharacterized protein YbbK (DUF523 family)
VPEHGGAGFLDQGSGKAAELGQKIEMAILKANSPSCGSGKIYDGTFSGVLIEGDGIFAAMLKERGIPVFSEHQKEEAKRFSVKE